MVENAGIGTAGLSTRYWSAKFQGHLSAGRGILVKGLLTAYSTISAALHDIEQWYDKHLAALIESRQLSVEKTEELRIEANKGEMELERKLSEEAWIIPDEFRLRVEALTAKLTNYRGQEWTEYLEHGYSAISDAKSDLRNMARKHLKTKMH